MKQNLVTYLSDAEDNKMKEIEKKNSFNLTKEHLEILDKERERHINGKTKSYNKQDAFYIIKGNKKL